MQENVMALFQHYSEVTYIISILLNIVIAIFALVPSFFLTAANILFFGFWEGTMLSYLGEIAGAIVSFWLYRKGFRKFTSKKQVKNKLSRLLTLEGIDAFFLILSLRLLPFVPSGVVTFMSAIGKVSLLIFASATLIGKAPALLIEAYSVYQVTNWTGIGKTILAIFSVISLIFILKRLKK